MNILITGGAGYIGLELAYKLTELPEVQKITIYDSLIRANYNIFSGLRKFEHHKLKFKENDILDSHSLNNEISNSDIIFHLAAQVPSSRGTVSPHFYEQINNWGSAVLADQIAKHENKTLIYLSSYSVYGPELNTLDTNSVNPIDPYGISKFRGERHFLRLANTSSNKVIIARSPSVFGYSKNLRTDSIINRMIFDAKLKNKAQVRGDYESNAPHIYLPDLIKHLIALLNKKNNYSLINIPSYLINSKRIAFILQKVINNVDIIHVDQGQYSPLTQVSELDGLNDISDEELESMVNEFIKTFTF